MRSFLPFDSSSFLACFMTRCFILQVSVLRNYPGFSSPMVFPSGFENRANIPVGIFTGGTSVFPPK